jgi:outer membrane protein assembly factor BamB
MVGLLALGLHCGTAKAQLQKGAPWPAERGDRRNSGCSAYPGPTRLPREQWRLAEGEPLSPPILVDRQGVVYYAAGDAVVAVARDGSVRWRRGGLTTPALIALSEDGSLWVRTGDPAVLAVNAADGETRSETLLEAYPSAGQLGQDGVLYAVSGQQVAAIDAAGHLLWTSDPFPGRLFLPAVDGEGRLLVPFSDGVTALSTDGAMLWEHARNDLTGLALASDESLRVAGQAHSIVQQLGLAEALDGTGRYLWEVQTPGISGSAPAVDGNGTTFIGSAITHDRWGDGALYAIDADGAPLWRCELARDKGNTTLDAPVIGGDGTVYVVVRDFDETRLCAVSPAGDLLWELPGEFASPTPGDRGQLYVIDGSSLVALTDAPEPAEAPAEPGPEPTPGPVGDATDDLPPAVICLDPVVATDPGKADARVPDSAIATWTDPDGDACELRITPAGPYPVGITAVEVTCTDAFGASALTFGTVTVEDHEAPSLACPKEIRASQNVLGGARVSFSPSVSDNSPGATVTCLPASGSLFPPGTTTVRCTATDASGNTSTGSFTVTVTAPQSSARASVSGNCQLSGTINRHRPQLNVSVTTDKAGRVSGRLTFTDPAAGLTFRAAKLTALVVDGARCRVFGQVTVNGRGKIAFCLSVTDVRRPGRTGPADTVALELANGYTAGGPVVTGDLKLGQ